LNDASKSLWSLDELFNLFPEYRRPVKSVRQCLQRLSGTGRFLREREGGQILAKVTVRATPAAIFSVMIGAGARAEYRDDTAWVRAILRGVLEGTTRREPPAWACRLECTGATSDPMSDVGLGSMAVQDVLQKPGWEPPDPTSESGQRRKVIGRTLLGAYHLSDLAR
jgi:hypothetical protein